MRIIDSVTRPRGTSSIWRRRKGNKARKMKKGATRAGRKWVALAASLLDCCPRPPVDPCLSLGRGGGTVGAEAAAEMKTKEAHVTEKEKRSPVAPQLDCCPRSPLDPCLSLSRGDGTVGAGEGGRGRKNIDGKEQEEMGAKGF